jgi:hypothetical protein
MCFTFISSLVYALGWNLSMWGMTFSGSGWANTWTKRQAEWTKRAKKYREESQSAQLDGGKKVPSLGSGLLSGLSTIDACSADA